MKLTLDDLLAIQHLEMKRPDLLKTRNFHGVSTDSRTIRRGEIFFALRGETFDGHAFIGQALARGAACVAVDKRADVRKLHGKPVLVVRDTTKALGDLAHVYRKKFDIPIIAVAGSNGKTTTKEMISAVLRTKSNVLSTKGNLNNNIGVPQTLFRLHEQHDAAVVELGTNHPGELKYLCDVLCPTHGVITNIGSEHLEFFRDLSGVAKEEGTLFSVLGSSGTGFVNEDDGRVAAQAKKLKTAITYGFSSRRVNVRGKYLGGNKKGCARFSVKSFAGKEFEIQLSVPGRHTMANALAAAAIGLSFDVPPREIQRALKLFFPVDKRMEMKTVSGVVLLNDTYNANPDSVLSALDTLDSMTCKGKKIIILADMLELGKTSRREHKKIAQAVVERGFAYVLTYGDQMKAVHNRISATFNKHFQDRKVLSRAAADLISSGDIVLVKGSRGMNMNEVVDLLIQHLEKKAT